MAHCQNCGSILREGATFCPNCGQKVTSFTEASQEDPTVSYTEAEFELEEEEPSASYDSESSSYEPYEPTRPEEEETSEYAGKDESKAPQADPGKTSPKKKISGLSITAFILSLTIVLSIPGIILAIIDLVKSRTQPRKKGMSIAALIIGVIFMLLAFIGNNIENIQNLMAPKEMTLAEIRGGTPYSGDGFSVVIGEHDWEGMQRSDSLLFYPCAEKGAEGGPSTSIRMYSSPSDSTKTPQELVESAMNWERFTAKTKAKSLSVQGGYKGSWAEGEHEGRITRFAYWKAENRIFSVVYYGVGLDSDGEAVYQDILNSFQVTAQGASSAQADSGKQDPQDAPDLDGTLLYSPENELDFAFILTDPDFTAQFNEDTVYLSRSSGMTDATIVVSSIATAELSPEEQNPDVVIQDFMTSIGPLASGDYQITKIEVNGGYMASYSEGELDNSSVCVASWITGKRLYLVALVEPEKTDAEAESVFHNLMRSFQPASAVTPPQADHTDSIPDDQVVSIALGCYSDNVLLGLRKDGKVIPISAQGEWKGFLTSDWTDICELKLHPNFCSYILGLKKDGTVVIYVRETLPDRDKAERAVQSWSNIVSVESGKYVAYGVRKDGTVSAAAIDAEMAQKYMSDIISKVEKWTDIQTIREIGVDVYGIKRDGSIVTTNVYLDSAWGKSFQNVLDIDGYHVPDAVLYTNGSVEQLWTNGGVYQNHVGKYYDVPSWNGIRKLCLEQNRAFGLKQDGTVAVVYSQDDQFANNFDQCNVSDWKNIVDIAAVSYMTVGLTDDGKIVITGAKAQINNLKLGSWVE